MKIAFIGGGNMASALIGGLIKRGAMPADLYAIDPNDAARQRLGAQFGIRSGAAPDAQLQACDALVLAVKPQMLQAAAQTLAPLLARQLVISIAAGIRATDLARWLGGYRRIVRAMPNTPALIGQGITGLAALPEVDAAGRALAETVLQAVGPVVWCTDESQIDAITALSGSGPAYVFYFIEALQEAAAQLGLNADQGRALALATFTGAAQLAAQSDEPANVLRARVTSKGGTTAAAVASFEADQVKQAIVRAVLAANARSRELGDELGAAGK